MTKKLSKLARTTRVDNCAKLLKSCAHNSNNESNKSFSAAAENTAFEILVESNSVHAYRQSIVNALFDRLAQNNVPEYKQQYAALEPFINPLELKENDKRIKPLTAEERQYIFPPTTIAKLTDDQIAEFIGVRAADWKTIMFCTKCKGPAELKDSAQMRSADESQTLSLYCKKCNFNWKTSN